MTQAAVLKAIRDVGVIPVVRARSADEALRLAGAIRAGGLPILEITLTVPGALRVIERLAQDGGDVLVGAGTVLDAPTARACIGAGARFIVSPVVDAATVALCRARGIAVIPGALTPGEIVHARSLGADAVKVFPVSALGGPAYIRALKAVLPDIELLPTGGVTLATAARYIEAGAIAIGVGSELVDVDAIRRGRPQKVTVAARRFAATVRKARGRKGAGRRARR